MANQEFTNVACGDDYTGAATIRDVFTSGGGAFAVVAQPAKYKLQYGGLGEDFWTPEATIGTGGGIIPAGVTGVAFRNAVAGQVATVSALIRVAAQPHLALSFADSVINVPIGMQLIQSLDLTASHVFSAIPQTFAALELIVVARSARATTADQLKWILSNDGGANYDYSVVQGFGGAVSHVTGFGTAAPYCGSMAAATAAAGLFGDIRLRIADYASNTPQKIWSGSSVAMWGAAAGSVATDTLGGVWHNTAPVTQIQLDPQNAATFLAGSVAFLYGLPAS